MTGRCPDFPGPPEPVIATSHGWVSLDESHAADLAVSGMLLACTPEHVEQFRGVQPVAPLTSAHSTGRQFHAAP